MERRENEYERKGEMKGKEAKGREEGEGWDSVREESEEGGVGRKGREGKCWNA